MIIYNVATRFFDMKADANAHRVSLSLPVSAMHKITVNDRLDLVELLTALVDASISYTPEQDTTGETVKAHIVPEAIPACVPQFLLNKQQAAQRARQMETTNNGNE